MCGYRNPKEFTAKAKKKKERKKQIIHRMFRN